jgi:hypothetical protein
MVICTGRADPKHGTRHIKPMRMTRTPDGEPAFTWRGKPPVTGYAHADGSETYEFDCGVCHRHMELSRKNFAQIVLAIAAVQGTWDTPVTVDISSIERAI